MIVYYISLGVRRIHGSAYQIPVKWLETEGGESVFQNMLTGKYYWNDKEDEEVDVKTINYRGASK